MRQLKHVTGNSKIFQDLMNKALEKIEDHESATIDNITYLSCMVTTPNGVEVEYSAFIELDCDSLYEEGDENDDNEDDDEEDNDDEDEDNYSITLNELMKDRNFNSDGCR